MIGAGIIPALFVSATATAFLAAMLWILSGGKFLLPLPISAQLDYFIGLAIEYSPYGGIAFLIHVFSICVFPSLSWRSRGVLYAMCGAVLGTSFLWMQIGLSGVTFHAIGTDELHIAVILGALTALITYAVHSVLVYGVKRMIANMGAAGE